MRTDFKGEVLRIRSQPKCKVEAIDGINRRICGSARKLNEDNPDVNEIRKDESNFFGV